jgi:hypothetical protein
MQKKVQRLIPLAVGLAVLSFVVGCQTVPYKGQARETKRKPQEGGIISLKENFRPEDREVADEKMKSNCQPLPFRVLEEGEIVVGQKVQTDAHATKRDDSREKIGSLFGVPVVSGQNAGVDSSGSSTTTAIHEWQISYQCGDAKKAKR